MNIVTLMGRLAAAPETKSTSTGKKVSRFPIAVDRRGKDGGVDYIRVCAWEKLADFCEKYLRKGTKIALNGRIQVRQYDDSNGQKRYATEVVASNIEFAESKKQDSGNEFGKESAEEIPF